MMRGSRNSVGILIFAALLLPLAGCGGGSGGGGGGGNENPQQPGNRAPGFTSAASVTVAENSSGTIHTVTANDPDNDNVTLGIAPGMDGALFALGPAGALSFLAPPDFESPRDSDGDNVYRLTLTASDGQAQQQQQLSVTVTNSTAGRFRVRRVATGFSEPLYALGVPDGSGRLFIVEKGGRVRILNPATGQIATTPFLDISADISTNGERGLLGLALAPDFAASGAFYVHLTNLSGDIEIRRYGTVSGNRDRADATTGDAILKIVHPLSNHNGGWIDFGPDGLLYIAIGDGGGSGDPAGNGQNRNTLLGKILRIDPAVDAFPADPLRDYRVPTGNPFATSGGVPEIWAFGLRNPFRASFDLATGNLWIGDVGQSAVEEIDLMRPGDGGANFGWSILEGTERFSGAPVPSGLTPPVAQNLHGAGPRQSITGGYVYRGPIELLQGHYVFGDFLSGAVWSIPISQLSIGTTLPSSGFTVRTTDFAPDAGTIDNIASFGQDQRRNLYIIDFDGEIFIIEPDA